MANAILSALSFAVLCSAVYGRINGEFSVEHDSFEEANGISFKENVFQPTKSHPDFIPYFVTLYLYTKKTGADHPCHLTFGSCENWESCGFNKSKDLVIFSHGYFGSSHGYYSKLVEKAYNSKKDVNLVVLDFSLINKDYLAAVHNAKTVGQSAAKVITFLQNNCGADPTRTEYVGFSLGAHICGILCAALMEKCARIFGLDPASPLISHYSNNNKLDKSDAFNVQILHTSSRGLSITDAFGHTDFYANGARNQYGCHWSQFFIGFCDHKQACTIFADSIHYPDSFKTNLRCLSTKDALSGNCHQEDAVTNLGELTNRSDRGIFYIDVISIYKKILPGKGRKPRKKIGNTSNKTYTLGKPKE